MGRFTGELLPQYVHQVKAHIKKGESAMAFVSGFTRIEKGSPRVHAGQTICGYMVFEGWLPG
jgi:hypothetical protein